VVHHAVPVCHCIRNLLRPNLYEIGRLGATPHHPLPSGWIHTPFSFSLYHLSPFSFSLYHTHIVYLFFSLCLVLALPRGRIARRERARLLKGHRRDGAAGWVFDDHRRGAMEVGVRIEVARLEVAAVEELE